MKTRAPYILSALTVLLSVASSVHAEGNRFVYSELPTDWRPALGATAPAVIDITQPGEDPTAVMLQDNRFQVSVQWRRPPQFPNAGPAFLSPLGTDDSGIFYFLNRDNLELLLKVLNGCGLNNHFWVFFAATTDVEFTVTVTDIQANVTQQYTNALGHPANAVTDTMAFSTCPEEADVPGAIARVEQSANETSLPDPMARSMNGFVTAVPYPPPSLDRRPPPIFADYGIFANYRDPLNDTYGDGEFDLTHVELSFDDEHLTITSRFIDAPPGFVRLFIGIDADRNPNTGVPPAAEAFGLVPKGSTKMGIEFRITVIERIRQAIVDGFPTNPAVREASVEFGNGYVTVDVPNEILYPSLAPSGGKFLLNNGQRGPLNMHLVIGTESGPTDIAPNQGHLSFDPNPPEPLTQILLNDNRFRVEVDWERPPGTPGARPALVSPLRTEDSGIFYFLDSNNLEFLIKVLDGCGINGNFWVFFAATTDVEFKVAVTDTQTGERREYFNALGQPANTVTDTAAFATCP